jgi:hypothetical protein
MSKTYMGKLLFGKSATTIKASSNQLVNDAFERPFSYPFPGIGTVAIDSNSITCRYANNIRTLKISNVTSLTILGSGYVVFDAKVPADSLGIKTLKLSKLLKELQAMGMAINKKERAKLMVAYAAIYATYGIPILLIASGLLASLFK